MVNHGKELGFYAKSPAKPSKDFKKGVVCWHLTGQRKGSK